MNFIEHLFHLAPDNGSGLTEFIILIVLAVPLLLRLIYPWSTRSSKGRVPHSFLGLE
jgi:hypothetical protein